MDTGDDVPLAPAYPFNEPAQPILLHDGPIGGFTGPDESGVVELLCAPRLGLAWRINSFDIPKCVPGSQIELILRRPDGEIYLPSWVRGFNDGWSNGASLWKVNSPLSRIVAHWFNLPDSHGPIGLREISGDGFESWWSGRWILRADGWKVTFDVRPDHRRVWMDLHKAHVYVMTHVAELRREDGETFCPADAEPVLAALHVGISFALGRWVAPMLPVGYDADGGVVWENWRVCHCDPAASIGSGWWYDQDLDSLADFLVQVIKEFADPDRMTQLRLQMMLAITATSDRGFVEQRVTSGAAGLEHIAWQTLVLGGRMTDRQYNGYELFGERKLHAHDRLRLLLRDAGLPLDIDEIMLPATARFVAEEKERHGRVMDGADIVTWTRNRLVHPQGTQENVYRVDGLIAEVGLLVRHYLSYLILHSLGYRGSGRDLRKRDGWVGEVTVVPWAED